MLFLLFALVACDTGTFVPAPVCTLEVPVAEPAAAAPGDSVRLTSRALTEPWDTVVTIGSTRAEVVRVEREGCSPCDDCLVDTGVSDCDPCTPNCDACSETCATCVEYAVVKVPELPDGDYPVVLTNVHGSSGTGTLSVVSAGVSTP